MTNIMILISSTAILTTEIIFFIIPTIKKAIDRKRIRKELKKEWETKTGVYSYLNKKWVKKSRGCPCWVRAAFLRYHGSRDFL